MLGAPSKAPQPSSSRPSLYPSSSSSYNSKFDALTIYDSFREELLVLTPPPVHLHIGNIDLSRKGSSTRLATVPVVWFPRYEAEYIQMALQLIDTPRIKEALRRCYLPAPYVPCALRSETDIVQASVLWLLHPVIKALQAQFANVACATEVTIGDCRCDALISIGNEPIAVVEYKSRGNIRWNDFAPGLIKDYSKSNRLEIRRRIRAGQDKPEESEMEHNAVCLTKQAAAYATNWQVRYVALFDWDEMFLWNFAGLHFQSSRSVSAAPGRARTTQPPGHAEWAFGTSVQNRRDYRSTLLGFVLEAHANKNSPGFKMGRPPPYEPTQAEIQRQKDQANARRQQQLTPQDKAMKNIFSDGRR